MRSERSRTLTRWPARLSCWAAARPAGPEPTTAIRLPVRAAGGSGATQPSSKARSTMVTSTALIVTGSSLMPSTHEPSHGAGHRRPVNSGKLFVACRRSIASRQWSRYTRSFQSGMILPSGQPWWQNGMPQSMQRAACFLSSSEGKGRETSFQSRSRSATGRVGHFLRPISRKPVTLPTGLPAGAPDQLGERGLAPLGLGPGLGQQHALVVLRHDAHEARLLPAPVVEDPCGIGRARVLDVAADQVAHEGDLVGLLERAELDHPQVAAALEIAVDVADVGDAARHAGGEVAAAGAEHHDAPAGHVLAAVVADALHHGMGAAVAHREPLAGHAAH